MIFEAIVYFTLCNETNKIEILLQRIKSRIDKLLDSSNPQAPQAKPYGRNKNSNSIGPRTLGEKDHVSDYYISQAFRFFARARSTAECWRKIYCQSEGMRSGNLSAGDGTASSKYRPESLFENQMSLFSICDGTTFISRGGIHLGAARDFFSLARPGVTFLAHLRCLKDLRLFIDTRGDLRPGMTS